MNTQVSTVTAVRGHVGALAFVAKAGTALSTLLAGVADAKAMEREGAIKAALFIMSVVNDDATQVPVVGSKQGETGNLPYDRYTSEVKTQDGVKKVPGSWYTDVVRNTPEAISIQERIALIDQGQGEGVPADIIAMTAGARAEERKRLKDRLSDMRVGLTKGAMLFQHVHLMNEMNPAKVKVKLPFRTETDGSVKVYGNSIRLQDPSGESEDDVFSISQFLQLDPDKAKADPDGGTIKSLKATAARAPRKAGGAAAGTAGQNQYPIPTTVEALLSCFNAIASALDTETDAGKKLQAALFTKLAKKDKDGEEALSSVGNACIATDVVWTSIGDKYTAMQQRKAAA